MCASLWGHSLQITLVKSHIHKVSLGASCVTMKDWNPSDHQERINCHQNFTLKNFFMETDRVTERAPQTMNLIVTLGVMVGDEQHCLYITSPFAVTSVYSINLQLRQSKDVRLNKKVMDFQGPVKS